jgi:hypothetical protein
MADLPDGIIDFGSLPFPVANQLLIAGDISGSRVFSIFELEKSLLLSGSCRTWIRHHPD